MEISIGYGFTAVANKQIKTPPMLPTPAGKVVGSLPFQSRTFSVPDAQGPAALERAMDFVAAVTAANDAERTPVPASDSYRWTIEFDVRVDGLSLFPDKAVRTLENLTAAEQYAIQTKRQQLESAVGRPASGS